MQGERASADPRRDSDHDGPDSESDLRALLLRRMRLVLWLMLAIGVGFTALELLLAPALGPHTVVKAFGLTAIMSSLILLHRPWGAAHVYGLSLLIISSAYAATALSAALSPSHEYLTTSTLFVCASLVTATLLPWGTWPQVLTVVVGLVSLAANVLWSDGTLDAADSDPGAAVVLALAASIAVAREMHRSRADAQHQDHLRRQAETEIRTLNATLERRVRDRTAELAAANLQLEAEIEERQRIADALRQRQDDLAHVQRLHVVNQMAALLAHEIHQPIGAIANYAQGAVHRLRAGSAPAPEILPVLEKIAAEALRAGGILRGVRRLVTDQSAPSEPIDVNDAVADAARMLEFQARRHGVELHVVATATRPFVTADRSQIEQVLVNLMLNGIDAVAGGAGSRVVHVDTAVEGEDAAITVSDTGPGIPPDTAAKLFKPFFTTKAHGLGMGLAISRSIVEAHGGELSLSSPPQGGAAFRITLPLAAPTAAGDPSMPRAVHVHGLAAKRAPRPGSARAS
jgi:signal transduction histidine kinase